MTKHIYLFSGLGADERMFQRLNFTGYSVNFIQWINPVDSESIEQYVTRLLGQITTSRPVLIGLSFGGLIAIEVAKQIDTERVIIIASAKTKYELPFYYRFAGKLRLHRLVPTGFLKRSNLFVNWFFGTCCSFDRQLLAQILMDTDSRFLSWAVDQIVRWKNTTKLPNIVHMHGTGDRILPYCLVNAGVAVKQGGHFMTINKSDEINRKLKSLL